MAYYLLYFIVLTVILTGTGRFLVSPPACIPRTDPSALYLTRARWLPLVPVPDYIYHRLPSSFTSDLEAGLSSAQFDISANIAAEDSRGGLDERAKGEVHKIMKREKVPFDEARRIFTQRRFARNNIGPDGRPRDPKFVSFS